MLTSIHVRTRDFGKPVTAAEHQLGLPEKVGANQGLDRLPTGNCDDPPPPPVSLLTPPNQEPGLVVDTTADPHVDAYR